jgi:AP-1 complex subunit beta-1
LDALSKYKSKDGRDAENIVDRVTPRLQHANCAVVLSAVKVILQQMELITSTDVVRNLSKKLAPPLVTLLSAEPEIQYVALRNINLIVQRRPGILAHEIKVFFCKYNDPIYVKMEKLEIMIKLASDRNIDQVCQSYHCICPLSHTHHHIKRHFKLIKARFLLHTRGYHSRWSIPCCC